MCLRFTDSVIQAEVTWCLNLFLVFGFKTFQLSSERLQNGFQNYYKELQKHLKVEMEMRTRK